MGIIPYIMKVESNFNPNCTTSLSSARGLIQMIRPTGIYIHTKLMGKPESTYNHDKQFDIRTNFLYGVTYFEYLLNRHGSVHEMLKRYSGWYSPYGIGDKYFTMLNKYMSPYGYTISKAQKEYESLLNK